MAVTPELKETQQGPANGIYPSHAWTNQPSPDSAHRQAISLHPWTVIQLFTICYSNNQINPSSLFLSVLLYYFLTFYLGPSFSIVNEQGHSFVENGEKRNTLFTIFTTIHHNLSCIQVSKFSKKDYLYFSYLHQLPISKGPRAFCLYLIFFFYLYLNFFALSFPSFLSIFLLWTWGIPEKRSLNLFFPPPFPFSPPTFLSIFIRFLFILLHMLSCERRTCIRKGVGAFKGIFFSALNIFSKLGVFCRWPIKGNYDRIMQPGQLWQGEEHVNGQLAACQKLILEG